MIMSILVDDDADDGVRNRKKITPAQALCRFLCVQQWRMCGIREDERRFQPHFQQKIAHDMNETDKAILCSTLDRLISSGFLGFRMKENRTGENVWSMSHMT